MKNQQPSTLVQLRELMPNRALTELEHRQVAERQAGRLLRILGHHEPPVPEAVIAQLPRVTVRRAKLRGASGSTQWVEHHWLIRLNVTEPVTRQRFSLAHEFKHVLDHPFVTNIHPDRSRPAGKARAERICDYFAACLLMPRPWVKRAWIAGSQDEVELAHRFAVSLTAMHVRLLQLGLIEPLPRCQYERTSASVMTLPTALAA